MPARQPAPELAAAPFTLEEIFLGAPPYGAPADWTGTSASGRFTLFRWRPLQRESQGPPVFADEERWLLVDASLGDRDPKFSRELAALLPQAGAALATGQAKLLARFAPRGELLLCAFGHQLWAVDPTTGSTRLLLDLSAEAAPGSAPGLERELGGAPASALPEGLAAFTGFESLEIADEGLALELGDAAELWRFELAFDFWERGWLEAGLSRARARCLSAPLAPASPRLVWSQDRSAAACFSEPIVAAAEGAPAPDLWRSDGSLVALEGLEVGHAVEELRATPDLRFVYGREDDLSAAPAPQLLPDWLGERVRVAEKRRENADTLPYPRRHWIWDTHSGAREELFAGAEAAWWKLIGWAPMPRVGAPARLALQRYRADWKRAETWIWSEGVLRLVLVEEQSTWVDAPTGDVRWSADGERLLFVSECAPASSTKGRAQLFALEAASGELRQLTAVAGEVDGFDLAGEIALVRFSASDPAQRHLAWLSHAQPGAELAPLPGFELPAAPLARGFVRALELSPGGDSAVFLREGPGQPGEWWHASRAGAKQLSFSAPEAFLARDWIRPQYLQVPAPDASTPSAKVHAQVFLPRGASLAAGPRGRARAAICFVHGAGYLQNVKLGLTEYPLNLLFHARLAELGYVVVDVDYRGSSGYGADFRGAIQYRLGELELADYHAVLDELAARGWIERDRVALYGGSYGGFLTLMALFREPGRWRAGAALRSVTDWRAYNPGYTQPRLGRPSTHPEAYARSSPIDHAEALVDPLYLFHGLLDDNVFAQDTLRLMEVLIDAGKDFEAMLYPSQAHGFRDGAHWLDEYTRIERFLLEHLGPP